MPKTGQVSMEYMIVVGFSLLMIIPIIAIYGVERESIANQVNTKQAHNIARQIVDSAETVYYLGEPAKTTLKVYMPNNVERATIGNYTVAFFVNLGKSITEVHSECLVNITGALSTRPGIQFIEIAAYDYVVNITNQ